MKRKTLSNFLANDNCVSYTPLVSRSRYSTAVQHQHHHRRRHHHYFKLANFNRCLNMTGNCTKIVNRPWRIKWTFQKQLVTQVPHRRLMTKLYYYGNSWLTTSLVRIASNTAYPISSNWEGIIFPCSHDIRRSPENGLWIVIVLNVYKWLTWWS